MTLDTEIIASQCRKTSGPWADEDGGKADLDARLSECGLFRVYREVRGYANQPRFGVEQPEYKLDRVLIPGAALKAQGWCYGAVGIECKAPGKKLGPVVCQCLDYGRAVWELVDTGHYVMCPWVFIWHLSEFGGDIESVMAQHRIGGACFNSVDSLVFKTGAANMLRVGKAGRIDINTKIRCGFKAGSR